MSRPACLTTFQTTLAEKLQLTPSTDINQHWALIQNALHTAGLVSCGLTDRARFPLHLLDTRRSTPVDSEHNEARLATRHALNLSLRKDREIWWSQRAAEMEHAAALGNFRKLFHLIGPLVGVSETICEANDELTHNQQRRLARWAEHFREQFSWPPAPAAPVAASAHVHWSVSTTPPSEAEIRKEIQALGRFKASGSGPI